MSRFDYVKYDEVAQQSQETFKHEVELLESMIEQKLPNSRYKSLALTALEEAYAWLGKAVRDEQIERNNCQGSVTEPQEERTNS